MKAKKKRYEAHFFHRGKWWVGWTDDVPGAVTQGRTLAEARENLKDAITLMLDPVDQRGHPDSHRVVHEVLAL